MIIQKGEGIQIDSKEPCRNCARVYNPTDTYCPLLMMYRVSDRAHKIGTAVTFCGLWKSVAKATAENEHGEG